MQQKIQYLEQVDQLISLHFDFPKSFHKMMRKEINQLVEAAKPQLRLVFPMPGAEKLRPKKWSKPSDDLNLPKEQVIRALDCLRDALTEIEDGEVKNERLKFCDNCSDRLQTEGAITEKQGKLLNMYQREAYSLVH